MLGNSTNKIFLSVADGKIVHKVKADTQGAHPRTRKDGQIVYEMKYGFITGLLTGIGIRTGEIAGQEVKEWQLDLTDGQEIYQLQVMYDSRYATSLLFALANPAVDFSRPITIIPWQKIVNDKKKTSCYVKQGDRDIDWFFTKDQPNGMPDLEQVTFKGKEVWDSFKRMQFLEKYVMENIKPKLGNPFHIDQEPAFAPDPAPAFATDADFAGPEGQEDDLPF